MKKYLVWNKNLNILSSVFFAAFLTIPAFAQREQPHREQAKAEYHKAQVESRTNIRAAERRSTQATRPSLRPARSIRVQDPGRNISLTRNNNTVINNRTQITNRQNLYNRGNYSRPIYDARNPGWRYAAMPRRNTIIKVVPVGYRVYNYGGSPYRYYNGVFYSPFQNSFRVVAPPIGIFINTMPFGYRRIYVNNFPYYYYYGTYYQYRNSNYYVVSPPLGAIVESLPAGYETLNVDGETFYTIDGAQYKPIVQDNGEVWYQVVKAN